jgi:hypothetical protein
MTTTQDAPNRRRDRRPVSGPAGSGGGHTFVGVFKGRCRSQGRCSCGWTGMARLFQALAKVDALIHAAQNDCTPKLPLIQPWGAFTMSPARPGVKEQLTRIRGSCQR